MSFFEELKRRKVIRVGIAYLVGSWLIVQVAELVAESFGAPAWFMQMLLVLVALGLPVALLLSWAFDLTPQGLVRDRDVTPSDSASSSRLLSGVTIALLVVALGYFVWESRWSDRAPGAVADTSAQQGLPAEEELGDSIAVLPFENFSGNKEDEYFADGLTDTLLHKLAQIEQLRVIARNSTFQFKGQNRDIREIGKILDVDIVLEGSVQRAGNQVRIIAQLIRASDGAHLWSQSFDDSMDNIFELQDNIAAAIADQLHIDLTAEQRRKMLRDGTSNPAAYDLLIRGINEEHDFDDMADVDDATWPPVVLIKQALELDPEYAQAWSALSDKYNFLAFSTHSQEKYPYYVEQSELAASKAIELAPEIPDGYVSMGWVAHRKRERLEAQQHFRRALEIDPNSFGALSGLALQVVSTNPEEALELLDRGLRVQPTSSIIHRQKHFALSALGRYDEAIEELRTGIGKDSDAGLLYNDLADLLILRKGQVAEAAVAITRFVRLSPHAYQGQAAMLEAWSWTGGSDEAREWSELLLKHQADSEPARRKNVDRLIAAGQFTEALDEMELLPISDRSRWVVASARARTCLGARQGECARQQGQIWQQEVLRVREMGGGWPEYDVYPLLVEILAAEITGEGADQSARLSAIDQLMREYTWFDTKFYLKAGIAARTGDFEQAYTWLEQALHEAGTGIFGLDIFGMSMEHSLLLDPLRNHPEFQAWLERHLEQRNTVLSQVRQLESRGEIISASSTDRLIGF